LTPEANSVVLKIEKITLPVFPISRGSIPSTSDHCSDPGLLPVKRNYAYISNKCQARANESEINYITCKTMKGNNIVPSPKYSTSLTRSLGLMIGVVGFLCYVQTLSYQYTLDDFSMIKGNHVTTMGAEAIGTIFKTPYRHGYTTQGDQLYRPVPKSIFAILWSISPNNPFPAHLLNVLLYSLTGFLLFITLIKYMGSKIHIAFITSLIFIVHPVHSEVVANIKSLDEILSLLFFLLSVYWIHHYLSNGQRKWIVLASFSFLIALLSKESAITYIAIFPLTIYFFTKSKPAKILSISLWMMIPVVITLSIRSIIFNGQIASLPPIADNMLLLAGTDFLTQKATAIYLMGYYLKILLLPYPLVFDYSLHQLTLVQVEDWRFLLSLAVYLVLGFYALVTLTKKNLAAFCILFFLITTSISSNIFKLIGTHFAERLMYAPSIGFSLLITLLLSTYLDRKDEVKQKINTIPLFFRSRPILISVSGIVALGLTFLTIAQTPAWRNNLSLFEHGVRHSPQSMRTHYYLGNYLIEGEYYNSLPAAQQIQERNRGINELKKSIAIYPYSESYFSLGIAHYLMHAYDSSMYYYSEAIKLAPYIAKYHNNIATVYFELKQLDKAIASCQKAVQLDPNYAEAYCNLGSAYGSLNQMDEALINFEKALSIDPNHARSNYFIGKILQISSKPEDQSRAQYYLVKARSLDANYAQ
jgi:hypothetical protein